MTTNKGNFPIEKFRSLETPFYYYDSEILRSTLDIVKQESEKYNFHIHYAIKANANPKILSIVQSYGLGVDCVSGGEIQAAINAGFNADKIVFAGVGKSDKEINLALDSNIFCFNVESIPELEVINELAAAKGKIAKVALRINPEVDAKTHHYITTGLKENKFGISMLTLDSVLNRIPSLNNIELIGTHFHVGSQITDYSVFENVCERINIVQEIIESKGIEVKIINVGGGLGINYNDPNGEPISDFARYFEIMHKNLKVKPNQEVHFEPGRSIVCQCGSLITRVLYIKEGVNKKFAIVDGGMTELIRPALYQAYHKIENISSEEAIDKYDVVGPICESSDAFGKDVKLNKTKRGDLIALRSAGAYGEIMASQYNCRALPASYLSEEL
ncbi:MAG: diaminopimelate decarboxylase [Bacteroidales bacterium]